MKDRIINFLLIFLLIFFIVNILFSWKKDVSNKTWIKVDTSQKLYTIPANLSVNISNFDDNDLIIDTCKDIQIKKDDKIIIKNNCWEVIVKSKETKTISYKDEYNLFKSTWTYFLFTNINWKEYTNFFEIDNPWFLKKFFVFFFYQPIYNLMIFLLELTSYSLGWSIIIMTIIIRLILLIPQHKMMLSQRKMQLIQPKIKKIQEKYKWNHQMLWMELMKLYKEEKVNPFGSCWLLLIQMPILIVIYYVIIGIQDISNQFYLYSFLWDYKVDLINSNFYWIDLFQTWWWWGLILAIIVWLLQFIQLKLSLYYTNADKDNSKKVLKKKKWTTNHSSMTLDSELINKFMLYWLPIMIMIFTYSFFAWVGLYWGIWTLFMIFQQLFINKVLKK